MDIRRLPRDAGPAAWNAILAPARVYSELDASITADWLIIGAGFAGLSAARRLRQLRPDDRIVILDARRIAEGPAGRNSGFMIDLPHVLSSNDYGGNAENDRQQATLNRQAIKFAAELVHEQNMSDEAFTVSGKINGAASARGMAHNQNYARHLDRLGEPYDMLDAQMMREITGSDYYKGGLFTPGTAMLQPALYVRGLADNVTANSVQLCENSPVIGLKTAGADWIARTPKGQVTAPGVILAVNGHAESFGFFRRRLMPIVLFASMTRPLTSEECRHAGAHAQWGITPADPMGTTMRRISGTGGDRIITRNRVTYHPTMNVTERELQAAAKHHDRSFTARYPKLANVNMEYQWSGQLCLSRNDAPAFGEVRPGLIAACCQNGLGTTKGTLAGIAAAELATREQTKIVEFLHKADGPAKLPPEPFCSLGANAIIRWKEFRAGAEK